MRWLADLVYLLAGLLYLPVVLYQAVFQGKNRSGWGERLGFVRTFDPTRPRIWLHAVSLGEVNATPRLVEALRARLPDVDVVVSTTTDTGYARAVHLFGPDPVFRFPLDFSLVVARVLRRVRPTMLVLVELEVWFNLVRQASRAGIPVTVVNGRLTARSARRLARLGPFARAMFRNLAWVGAQEEAIAERFRDLGASSGVVEVTSSLKWDSATVTDRVEGADALAAALGIDGARPLWVCGSTGPGEEAMILGAYSALLRDRTSLARSVQANSPRGRGLAVPVLVLVPRKPERFDEVARAIERAGFGCLRRSACGDGTRSEPVTEGTVVLGDTMGELRKFYSLANVVFVGRSLVPLGGSDPMEVAALGKPVVVGPNTDNFRLPVEALQRADAIRVVESADALPATVASLLRDLPAATALGARAREVVVAHQGATGRTAEAIVRVFHRAATRRGR
jgi:3-deoxy-D-manno-octulosonic-acid transferase